MSYGKILAQLRKENNYKQSEVADYISRYSKKPYSLQMVSHWENGVSSPPVEQFLLMCELYKVKDIQGIFRGIKPDFCNVSRLNKLGINRMEEYISLLTGNPLFIISESSPDDFTQVVLPRRYIKQYHISAAAGTGEMLDSDAYDFVEADETVPQNADFAVKINGDSMEPRFIDGQVVFIKEQRTLNPGEIGIFGLNGESYIKKLGDRELLSLNPNYEPIHISVFDSLHVFGKVVG